MGVENRMDEAWTCGLGFHTCAHMSPFDVLRSRCQVGAQGQDSSLHATIF